MQWSYRVEFDRSCCVVCRDAVDLVSVLYNQVDEEVHKLVILSNKSLRQLEKLLELRVSQERHQEVRDPITFSIRILKLSIWT